MSDASAPGIRGLRAAPDAGGLAFALDADCDVESFRQLLGWLPPRHELSFFDPHFPGTRGDPGGWVYVQRRGDWYLHHIANHGWSTEWTTQSAALLAAWMALGLLPAQAPSNAPSVPLRVRIDAQLPPAFGTRRPSAGVEGLLLRALDYPGDEAGIVALWQRCGLTRPWNDPAKDIRRKLVAGRELFVIGEHGGRIVATAMAGYDGHRGWVNYLAVEPSLQGRGIGRAMMAEAERLLRFIHCPKINVQVREGNDAALAFYARIGFVRDDTVSLGKRLEQD